jgi:GTP-binding protein HflX
LAQLVSTKKAQETAVLVGLKLPKNERWEVEDYLHELAMLTDTAGAKVLKIFIQEKDQVDPKTLIGSGKLTEIFEYVTNYEVDMVIFDDDLTPGQIRRIENKLQCKILDRSSLILDIFAQHARTKQAKTQVEMAQLEYILPRLTRMWTHLSSQKGGSVGMRGPGETQLEIDKRLIQKRIAVLKAELDKIHRQHDTRKKNRTNEFKVALIGYTNVGKSTILNALTGSNVLAENKLFATLDSTVRKVFLSKDHQILLSDTVGFIRKLPHQLVASFKSTLDEALDADLLLHVVDLGHKNYEEHIKTVNLVLQELKLAEKPLLIVFNKLDLVEANGIIQSARANYKGSIFVSALKHIRLSQIKTEVLSYIEKQFVEREFILDFSEGSVVNSLYVMSKIMEERYEDDHIFIKTKISIENEEKIKKMREGLSLKLKY